MMAHGHMAEDGPSRQRATALAAAGDLVRGNVEERGSACAEPALGEAGEVEIAGAQEGVGVVGHERPGVEARAGVGDEVAEAIEEGVAIAAKDPAPFDAAGYEVMQGAWEVEARSARHKEDNDGNLSRVMSRIGVTSCRSSIRPFLGFSMGASLAAADPAAAFGV
jgi:hypothetical protein